MGKTGNRFSGSQKMSAVLSIYANVFSVGPCLYFINREDRRYTKKMTLANKSAIFHVFRSFYKER